MDKKLRYVYTNESLPAIMTGLDIQRDDRVLTIAGSGDQAFAFLEYASYVKAVDISLGQINLTQQRVEQLRARDYDSFLYNEVKGSWSDSKINAIIHLLLWQVKVKEYHKKRNNYFRETPERLDNIRENLENLVVVPEPINILQMEQNDGEFSKIYLSNAIAWSQVMGVSKESHISVLNRLGSKLQTNGLIYVCSDNPIRENNLTHLRLDTTLTQATRPYEHRKWSVRVYRKVA